VGDALVRGTCRRLPFVEGQDCEFLAQHPRIVRARSVRGCSERAVVWNCFEIPLGTMMEIDSRRDRVLRGAAGRPSMMIGIENSDRLHTRHKLLELGPTWSLK
jgi:hypothetical protein